MDVSNIARLVAWLAALGAIVLFGTRFVSNVARKVPA